MIATRLHRSIGVYEAHGDAFVAQIPVSDREFDAIRSYLGYDDTNPMFDVYPLKNDVLDRTAQLLGERFRTGDYEYFLETEAD